MAAVKQCFTCDVAPNYLTFKACQCLLGYAQYIKQHSPVLLCPRAVIGLIIITSYCKFWKLTLQRIHIILMQKHTRQQHKHRQLF